MDIARDVKIILLALLVFYIGLQIVLLPVRYEACSHISHAALINHTPDRIRLQGIMCSVWKFIGVTDILRTLSTLR